MEKHEAAMVRKAFGERMRDIRRRKGIAQERLALESGLNRGYVGRVERGEQNISLVNICRIAAALRVPPSDLLAWEENGSGQPADVDEEQGELPLARLGDMLSRMNETMLMEMGSMLREAFAAGERRERRQPEGSGQPERPVPERKEPPRAR